jgi:hypothetical protein
MKRLAVASSKWKVRLQTWSLEFEWSREIRGRIVRWTVANTVAGVTAAGLFWSLDRSWPYAPLPVVALALLAFGAILGASQWLALRGWSSLSKWWLLAAPLAGFGGWLCGLIVGSVTVVTVLVSSGPGAAGWTFILILPVAAGLATGRRRSPMGTHEVTPTAAVVVAYRERGRRDGERCPMALRSRLHQHADRADLDAAMAWVCGRPNLRTSQRYRIPFAGKVNPLEWAVSSRRSRSPELGLAGSPWRTLIEQLNLLRVPKLG